MPQQTVENALQGKVPGAVITSNSGAPGGGVQLQLRGTNTVNGNYQPLYVVDGVIADNSSFGNGLNAISGAAAVAGQAQVTSTQDQQVNRIADINPEDIETIEVLKGPSAGAIYGSRGANGVVIITTKRGQAGRAVVDFTQRFGTQEISNKLGSAASASGAKSTRQASIRPASVRLRQVPRFRARAVRRQGPIVRDQPGAPRRLHRRHDLLHGGSLRHDAGIQKNTGYDKQSLRVNLGQTVGSRLNVPREQRDAAYAHEALAERQRQQRRRAVHDHFVDAVVLRLQAVERRLPV